MAWSKDSVSPRRTELPSYAEWKRIRSALRERAGDQCERYTNGVRCPRMGTDANHIGDNKIHELANLEWLCGAHHREFTAKQAAEAKRKIRNKLKHPWEVESHPGLIGGRNVSVTSKTRSRPGTQE